MHLHSGKLLANLLFLNVVKYSGDALKHQLICVFLDGALYKCSMCMFVLIRTKSLDKLLTQIQQRIAQQINRKLRNIKCHKATKLQRVILFCAFFQLYLIPIWLKVKIDPFLLAYEPQSFEAFANVGLHCPGLGTVPGIYARNTDGLSIYV